MRRTAKDHGFLLCMILNMLFRFEWAAVAIALLVIHFWIGWPLFLVFVPLSIWILHAFLVTMILSLANRAGNEPIPDRPNKNPYSKTNADYHYEP